MKQLHYSAAYYPELWDWDVIRQDVEHMKKVGLNAVRIGEFAWSNMEPEEGKIDLSFFHQVIEYLYENGIDTILCTPTPTPPIWMTHNHPERLYVNQNGQALIHGGRQHACTNQPYFRQCSNRIVEAMARELGTLPGVIAWQLDNEFKCHVSECMCDTCKGLWHQWLEEKYGDIQSLNNAWGAQIWSEEYRSFDQVPQPLPTPMLHNTSLALNYKQFSREKIAEFAVSQAAIIRSYSAAPITHNTFLTFALDQELLFDQLDFVSYDMYPNCDQYHDALFCYDLYRSLKQDGKFWLMETSPSHNGCTLGSQKIHRKGYLKAEVLSACAAGAETVSYWLWRQQRSGCEQLHGSILSSWGKPAIGYGSAVEAGKEMDKWEPLLASSQVRQAQVAISYSDRARSMFMIEPLGGIDYLPSMMELHGILCSMGIERDFLFENSSFEGYKVVITPYMPYLSDSMVVKGRAFVEQGGIWIIGPMSSYRTEELTVPTDYGMGNLEKVFGFESKLIYPIQQSGAQFAAFGKKAEATRLGFCFASSGEAVGRFEGGATDGEAAALEFVFGKGKLVLMGAALCGPAAHETMAAFWQHYFVQAEVFTPVKTNETIACTTRIKKSGEEYYFLTEMSGKTQTVSCNYPLTNVETGEKGIHFSLPAYQAIVLKN